MGTIENFPFALPGILLALLLATLVHEGGHLVTARLRGIPIRLVAFGIGRRWWGRTLGGLQVELRTLPVGMSVGIQGRWDREGLPRYGALSAAAVAAGGPVAGLLLMGGLMLLSIGLNPAPPLNDWLVATATLSLILTLLNLIPLPGLDGGHLMLSLMDRFGLRLPAARVAMLHRSGLRLMGVLAMGSLLLQILGLT